MRAATAKRVTLRSTKAADDAGAKRLTAIDSDSIERDVESLDCGSCFLVKEGITQGGRNEFELMACL